MDLDNRSGGQPDFDPRFAPPADDPRFATPGGYARPQPPADRGPALVAVAVAALVVLAGAGYWLTSRGGGGGGEPAYKTVKRAGFRIDVPEHFVPGKLQIPDPSAKLAIGDDEDRVSVVVYVIEKSRLPGAVSIDKFFDVVVDFLDADNEVEEMSETVTVRVGEERALQQVTRWKRFGQQVNSLHTVVEGEDTFYLIEVNVPLDAWGLWEDRAKKITVTFAVD